MMGKFINRENQIFDILSKIIGNDIELIIVGGYAVSAFSHRFSVDADIIHNERKFA